MALIFFSLKVHKVNMSKNSYHLRLSSKFFFSDSTHPKVYFSGSGANSLYPTCNLFIMLIKMKLATYLIGPIRNWPRENLHASTCIVQRRHCFVQISRVGLLVTVVVEQFRRVAYVSKISIALMQSGTPPRRCEKSTLTAPITIFTIHCSQVHFYGSAKTAFFEKFS